MSLSHGSSIVTTGLRHCTDLSNIKSYTSGTNITDLITNTTNINGISNSQASWMNAGVNQITITAVIKRLTAISAYSLNPLSKYSSTTDNTFNLYVFGNSGGANPADDGRLLLYSNNNGNWGSVGNSYTIALNETVIATIQFNSITGGQLWINGTKIGPRAGVGILGSANNTSSIIVYTPPVSNSLIMYYSSIYDRELLDSEVKQNFNALRGRYSL